MNLRSALLAAAALAAAIGICLALGRWGAGRTSDLADLARAVRHGEELEPHIEAGQRRHEAKRSLGAEVVAGRMTVSEEVGRFRRLDEAHPGYPPGLPCPPGDDRFYCGQVLDFGWVVLVQQGRYAAAARWCAAVFTAHPHVLAGPPADHRYYAACAAVRAGCGQARDGTDLDETSRAGFRRQALDWLRAELEARRRLLEQDPVKTRSVVVHDLYSWLGDPYFAGVRGPQALARLPGAERQAWQRLWAEVADTRARAVGMLAR
jgi:hypothetical protein